MCKDEGRICNSTERENEKCSMCRDEGRIFLRRQARPGEKQWWQHHKHRILVIPLKRGVVKLGLTGAASKTVQPKDFLAALVQSDDGSESGPLSLHRAGRSYSGTRQTTAQPKKRTRKTAIGHVDTTNVPVTHMTCVSCGNRIDPRWSWSYPWMS